MEEILNSYPALVLIINSISVGAGVSLVLYKFLSSITKPLEKIADIKEDNKTMLNNQNEICKYLVEIKTQNRI